MTTGGVVSSYRAACRHGKAELQMVCGTCGDRRTVDDPAAAALTALRAQVDELALFTGDALVTVQRSEVFALIDAALGEIGAALGEEGR